MLSRSTIARSLIIIALMLWSAETLAELPAKRVALQLSSSSCRSHYSKISSALVHLPGVRAVDLESIPDHALVDIDPGTSSVQEVLETVRGLLGSDDICRIDPMESCISADLFARSGRQPAGNMTAIP